MKKLISIIFVALLSLVLFVACSAPSTDISTSIPVTSEPVETVKTDINVASLKGPTTMGMVKLMKDSETDETLNNYNFSMHGTPDEIVPNLIKGDIDIALVPANLASVIYNNTEGKVQVAAINTLGVLYIVETGDSIQTLADLEGKTIYSTGKGTTPEFVLSYLLTQSGVNATIEYKSEATEVAAMLEANADAVALLPQPYVTAVLMQNENARIALDTTEEWNKISPDSTLVTGVVVVRKDWAEKNPEALQLFLQEYELSTQYVNENIPEAAKLVVEYGIIAKEPMALTAIPKCNITYIDGDEMKTSVSDYLQVLADANIASIGGELPKDDFYYGATN